MSAGTEQRERLPKAWEDGRFQVDDMGLAQRVQLCAGLAERLHFVDLNNQPAGTWLELFESDESMVLARIASFGRQRRQRDFLRRCDAAPLAEVADAVMQLALQLDHWFKSLAGNAGPEAAAVGKAIEQRVQRQLGGRLAWVCMGGQSWASSALRDSCGSLQQVWSGHQAVAPHAAGHSPRLALRHTYFSFLSAIAQVQRLARELLESTLDSEGHEPAPGLLLAFLRLYDAVRLEINQFADRHIDFYYRDCLGLRPRPAQADRVHVVCQRDPLSGLDVVVPAETVFAAGKDADGRPLTFRATQPLALSDARVAELCTLLLQRDRKISPEAGLGYIYGVKARRLGLPPADAPAVPLFGGGPGSSEATLGLTVATPLLLLKEGHRTIELTLRLAWPVGSQERLFNAVLAATNDTLPLALGAFFACWMLGGEDDLLADPATRQRLRLHAQSLLDAQRRAELAPDPSRPPVPQVPSPLELMCGQTSAGHSPRELAFFKYVNDLFEPSLTHAAGWLPIQRVQVGRPQAGQGPVGGLKLTLFLRPEDPAIVGCDPQVHGLQWPTRLPLLRLQVGARARIHPLSLLQAAELREVELEVDVRGVRDLVLQNNVGPLDASKSFSPFGPLPTTSSYLDFGAPEAAAKNLTSLALQLHWGGLPQEAGGFAAHYSGYGAEQSAGLFAASFMILRDGDWKPCSGASARQPLFQVAGSDRALQERISIAIDESSVRSHARASPVPLALGSGARDGLVRMQLKYPRSAFGHAAYASLLSQAVTRRTRRRGGATLPNPPYTPVLERISLDYSARTTLRPTAARADDRPGDAERLLHMHPFGVAELRADAQSRSHGVLPALRCEGNLFIGLQASTLEGSLTLLFALRKDGDAEALRDGQAEASNSPAADAAPDAAAAPAGQRRRRVSWFYLARNRWHALAPSQVLTDSTQGFLTSGVVTLDLRGEASNDNTVLTPGLFWLCAASAVPSEAAASLVSVHAQAVTLTREVDASAPPDALLPAGRITRPAVNVPGLAGVLQVEASAGLRPAEDERQFRIRAGERLRHKNRASLAWDVERLVLERFSEVFKVKCFAAHETAPWPELGGGVVLVVVVPNVRRNDPACTTLAPRLNAHTLLDIQDYLVEHATPFAKPRVRSATYERVQVRCSVQLERGAQTGAVLRRVQRVLTQYLSPWHDGGCGPRFGWTLRCDDVEAQVRAVEGVQAVGALSLLQVARSDQGYHTWGDSARPLPGGGVDTRGTLTQTRSGGGELRNQVPWSLALPLSEHLIELSDGLARAEPAQTGLAKLCVGSTFVIGRRAA